MSPIVIVNEVLSNETPVTETVAALTVTVQVAVFPPSLVFTVILAVPAAFAVTTPEEDTVATDVLSDDQVTDLLVAFEGVTVAVSVCVSPAVMDRVVLFRETPVTGTVAALTVTVQVAVFPPSLVFTVILAVPAAFAVTTPEEDTVATDVLSDDQVTDLSVAFEGVTVAVNVCVSPAVMVSALLSKDTPVTEMTFLLTVTEHVAVLPPSSVLTVMTVFPGARARTFPLASTVATDGEPDVHWTVFSDAFEGEILTVNDADSPSVNVNSAGERETDSTATYFPFFPAWLT